jgi:hypothetical protein
VISETTRSRNPAGHAGLLENVLALASALTEFFEGRFALFAQEWKAALVQLLVLAARLIVGRRRIAQKSNRDGGAFQTSTTSSESREVIPGRPTQSPASKLECALVKAITRETLLGFA